ncbi:MAG: hypothetical protein KBT27_09320 [Prevotellaceae bacterium]|nr:hypothetical protein [Candidatus Faecinaster equi]
MIQIENVQVTGWETAIRGMRNPYDSWEKSDSEYNTEYDEGGWSSEVFEIGENDHDLMMRLAELGPVNAKYRRMIDVTLDITAPLYWWKEFDTYKVGTVANSCSTMHRIQAKEFTENDFSHEHLSEYSLSELNTTIQALNHWRDIFNNGGEYLGEKMKPKNKYAWWQMIQLLPSSYNQRRTVKLNYEVLANIYTWRSNHKLNEWREFCAWIKSLPYSEIITADHDIVMKRTRISNVVRNYSNKLWAFNTLNIKHLRDIVFDMDHRSRERNDPDFIIRLTHEDAFIIRNALDILMQCMDILYKEEKDD